MHRLSPSSASGPNDRQLNAAANAQWARDLCHGLMVPTVELATEGGDDLSIISCTNRFSVLMRSDY